MSIKNFNEEQIQEVLKSHQTLSELAKEYNVPIDTIRYIFKKYKVKKSTNNLYTNSIANITEEQKLYFLNNFDKHPLIYFEKEFNTSEKVIRNLCLKNNLKRSDFKRIYINPNPKNYTEIELDYLKNNHLKLTVEEIANFLNRSTKSVMKKCWELDITYLTNCSTNWSNVDLDFLIKNHRLCTTTLAFMLERSVRGVEHKLKELNLKIKREKTSIEKIVMNILDDLKIDYVFNTQISKDYLYRPDFLIKSKNIIIECHGDYWHANPIIYSDDNLNNMQKLAVLRDQRKKEVYESLGYTYIVYWENEIEDVTSIKQKIIDLLK